MKKDKRGRVGDLCIRVNAAGLQRSGILDEAQIKLLLGARRLVHRNLVYSIK
jgi:hypothetical protein